MMSGIWSYVCSPVVYLPILLFAIRVFTNRIARGRFHREDCLLGIEFSFAAIFSAVVYEFDIVKLENLSSNAPDTALFIAAAGAFFMVVLLIHQMVHERMEANSISQSQFVFFAFTSNAIGIGLMISFGILFGRGD